MRDRSVAAALSRAMTGRVVPYGAPEYELLRRRLSWNARIPARYPVAIVRPACDGDLLAAIACARQHGIELAVRAGGHNFASPWLRDGVVVLDLSGLREIAVEQARNRASVQPGVTARELAAALACRGRAFPTGHCGGVGMSGFLLSGGLGWNPGVWGPACLSLGAVELMTADGSVVHADEWSHPALLWAARGAGPGFFAIASRFHLRTFELPRAVTRSSYVFPLGIVEWVAEWLAGTATQLGPGVELSVTLGRRYSAAARMEAIVAVSATAFADRVEEAGRALAPLERNGLPASVERDAARETTYLALHDDSRLFPSGHRYAVDSFWAGDLADVLPRLAERIAVAPSPKTHALATLVPPAGDMPASAAFTVPERWYVACYAAWSDEHDDGANTEWLSGTMELVAPPGAVRYAGETGPAADGRQGAALWLDPGSGQRLAALARRFDPGGLFGPRAGAE